MLEEIFIPKSVQILKNIRMDLPPGGELFLEVVFQEDTTFEVAHFLIKHFTGLTVPPWAVEHLKREFAQSRTIKVLVPYGINRIGERIEEMKGKMEQLKKERNIKYVRLC